MRVYFFFYIWIFLFAVNGRLRNNKFFRNMLIVSLGAFLCTGYMVGTDWRDYELLYNYYDRPSYQDDHVEIGYLLLNNFFSWIGVYFWHFYIVFKILCYASVIRFLLKYSKGNYGWALLFFYTYVSLNDYINCPYRNLIAATIFLYAIEALMEEKWRRYVVITLIASSFHLSALLVAPIMYLVLKKRNPFSRKTVIIGVLSFYAILIVAVSSSSISNLIMLISLVFGEGSSRSSNYLLMEGSAFSVGLAVILLFFVTTIYNRKEIYDNRTAIQMYNVGVFYILVYIGFYFVPILGRFNMFFYMPFLISLTSSLRLCKNKMLKTFSLAMLSLFLSVALKNALTRDYYYVPYSSYLQYVGRDKPAFNYRSNYNMDHSPYRNNSQEIEWRE